MTGQAHQQTISVADPTSTDARMPSRELQSLRLEVERLRQRNALLEAELTDRTRQDPDLFRFLFDTMDEGFCVIEFFDGPHGPLSDYIHILANAAYARTLKDPALG